MLYPGARGASMSGLSGDETNMQAANSRESEPTKTYANELDILSREDDVDGNGVFDPFGTKPNIHPDEGIFSDGESLPGYVKRDRFYAPSEVSDIFQDQPVMYVPGGAVAIDKAQEAAFNETLLWQLPPGVNPWPTFDVDSQSSVIPSESAWPISGLGADAAPADDGGQASLGKMFVMSAIGGLALGMVLAIALPRKA
jgi:hypothetical protein